MARFPGIDFRWTPAGRAPHVTGTGLSAWELYRIWLDHGRDPARVRGNYPHLTLEQVHAAIAYATAYSREIPPEPPPPPFAHEVRV